MRKLLAEPHAYQLVATADSLYYRVNRTGLAGRRDAFFRHDLTRAVEVTDAEYNLATYHAPLLPYQPGESVAFLPGGDTLRCAFPDSVVRQFDPAGRLLRELPGSIEAHGGIYSIVLDADGHLWTADPAYHQVAQYEVASGRKLYELVGSPDWEPGELNHPEEVVGYGPYLFISDMGHQRLARLHTRTHELTTYRRFEQQVWEYRRVAGQEVVRLQDGLYVL